MEENRWNGRIEKMMNRLDEPVPGETLVELYGGRRVLIEHHRGIIAYCREKIQIRGKHHVLCIQGSCMEISRMSADVLVVSGKIDGIFLVRRD
jgi:sporulation protein YqfC